MDPRFIVHNGHWEAAIDTAEDAIQTFKTLDPQLRRLKTLPYTYHAAIIASLPQSVPGIYTVGGGRQIGKTTLLKQWMVHLMEIGILPKAILFLTGDMIDDYHSLVRIMQDHLALMPDRALRFLIIDEITYIKDWDRGIKFLADAGVLDQVVVMLTGSDLVLMQEARMRFPGRRGRADQVDFHIYPLSFAEFVHLKQPESKPTLQTLYDLFDMYLLHGGFLTAINDYASFQHIEKHTLMTYTDWIRGDWIKRGRQESYLIEFFKAIVKTYGTQVAWQALSQHMSTEHPQTLHEYAALLASMDVLFVQSALLEHKLTAAPKKARKIFMTDPFIYHAMRLWLEPHYQPAPEPVLVEACVVTHMRRYYPTYYIKAEGEVDIAYIKDSRFWPIEIKWTSQLRPKDLKQIQKYPNGLIISKMMHQEKIHDVPSMPVPLFLYHLHDE